MTSTMNTMINLLMNKEENSVVSVAYGYKIIGACFDGRMPLDEARHTLFVPVNDLLNSRPFYWNTQILPYRFMAESDGYKFDITFETGDIKMYHYTENGWEETWKAPVSFQLMIVGALLEMYIIDHEIGA